MAQDEKNASIKNKKTSSSKANKEKKSKEKPPSKVIIRRLPPTMMREVFVEQISPLPENDFFYYVQGDQHPGVPTFSRAYINFVNQEDIFTFQDKFDGYVFLDERGNEYTAVVEFAPYQKIPRPEGGKEDKCNTLDNDPHYLEFLKKLENPEEVVLPSAESYLEQLEQKDREMKANGQTKITTPLVEFIVQRRLDRERYREEKKDEKRRKELEKKKQRDLERLNKKREARNKEEKRADKPQIKGKKEEQRPSNPVKVLKNTERQTAEKAEDAEGSAVAKKQPNKDPAKAKEKPKEKLAREPRPKPNKGPKPDTESGEASAAKSAQDEASPSQHAVKRAPAKVKDEPATDSKNSPEDRNASEGKKWMVELQGSEPLKAEGERTTASERRRSEKDGDKERKIRNKDRPAIQIYRPGAKRLSAQKQEEGTTSLTPPPEEAGGGQPATAKREVKSRTFSRSAAKE